VRADVGSVLRLSKRFFTPGVHQLSGPLSVMKYDLEISGFGSHALGHVCLLNLKEQPIRFRGNQDQGLAYLDTRS